MFFRDLNHCVSIFELWWCQRGFTFQAVSFYLSFQALVTLAWWGRTFICHTHGICVPPSLTLQAWNRTRPVKSFRLYRHGTTWSLKSRSSVLELLPFISVINYSVFLPLTQQPLVDQVLIIEGSRSHSSGEWTACCKDLYLTAHNTKKRNISMPLAGFGWALMHYAVRTEAGSTVRQTFLRLSSFRSLYLIISPPPSVLCSLYSWTHVVK